MEYVFCGHQNRITGFSLEIKTLNVDSNLNDVACKIVNLGVKRLECLTNHVILYCLMALILLGKGADPCKSPFGLPILSMEFFVIISKYC